MQPDVDGRASASGFPGRLFRISFAILFVEMAAIRWLNASVTVLAYFNNLILISCFFGLGVGCLLARRRVALVEWFAPSLLVLVVAVLGLQHYGIEISYRDDVLFIGDQDYFDTGLMQVSLAALAGFFLNVGCFVILGQELGRQLTKVRPPLRAYAWDIAGSLAGVSAYAALAWLQTPPHVWYAIAAFVLLGFLRHQRPRLWLSGASLVCALALMSSTYPGAEWSPYYKVETVPYRHTQNRDLGFMIQVDNLRIQDALRLSPELMRSPLRGWLPYYELPYHFARPEKVLILGAGSGNEAVMAYFLGAREIHAVEIDPVIARLGKERHPHRPYAAPEVKVFVDDARSYVANTNETYDLILMSALDSHKQIAGASSLRLESFVYTVESFREIRRLLAPGGTFCLSLASSRPWMGQRTYASLEKAFGRPPAVFTSVESPIYSESFVYAPEDVLERDLLPQRSPVKPLTLEPAPDVSLATDDWPHLYLENRSIPTLYLLVLGALMLLSTFIVGGIEPSVRRPSLHFFLLGAGFMLLETRSVTQMALLFGSTWHVNSVVFASILATILAANALVQTGRSPGPRACYAVLLPTLAAAYYFPFSWLLPLEPGVRVVAAGLVIGFPIFWASLIFSTSFRDEREVDKAFGSNLLGIVCGGALEYLSNVWGLSALFLVAFVLYAASALALPRRAAAGAVGI